MSQKHKLNGRLNKFSSPQLGFVFFSNTFIIDFSLDELNTVDISFYEMKIFLANLSVSFISKIFL